MNIFTTSRHPKQCARHLDDKRLNKMILETAQIICAVLHRNEYSDPIPYRPSHMNHPAVLWADDSDNIRWLYQLGLCYGDEIIHRTGRKHSSHLVLEGLTLNFGKVLTGKFIVNDDDLFNGARHRGLGLDFTHLEPVQAYRAYLNARWPNDKRAPTWKNRRPPAWKD